MSPTTTQTLCKYLQPSESVDKYIVIFRGRDDSTFSIYADWSLYVSDVWLIENLPAYPVYCTVLCTFWNCLWRLINIPGGVLVMCVLPGETLGRPVDHSPEDWKDTVWYVTPGLFTHLQNTTPHRHRHTHRHIFIRERGQHNASCGCWVTFNI